MSTRVPNAEQRAIVVAAKRGKSIKVVAGAGTGKTTTAVMVAEALRSKRIRYITYNRAAKEDAERRFPSNVKCCTSHGMAYRTHAVPLQHRMKGGRVPSWKAAQILGLNETQLHICLTCESVPVRVADLHRCASDRHNILVERLQPKHIAALATRTVSRFCYTADRQLDLKHVPLPKGVDARIRPALQEFILPIAVRVWRDVTSVDGRLQFDHDVYLKLFQLSNPRLPERVIILDEAQDTNPCVADIVLRQKEYGKQVILIGDPNQAIYEWRMARDAMAQFDADDTLYLTGSYRFGPEVALQANVFLELLGSPLRIKGWKKINSTVSRDPLPDPDAVLCRTNAGAISGAILALEKGKRVAIVGGGSEIERLAHAADSLMAGQSVDHPDLLAFDDWEQVRTYVKDEPEEAGQLGPLVRAIDDYGTAGILAMTAQLVDEDHAELIFSTAHKSKGREWPNVNISDADWKAPTDRESALEMPAEELRLSYVTVTRAQLAEGLGGLGWPHDLFPEMFLPDEELLPV